MPIPFLAGLTSFLGTGAGQTAIALGQGLGSAIKGIRNRNRQDSQIQRIVADARAAGIHPLAALGSPVSSSYGTPIAGDSIGDAIGALGGGSLRAKQEKLLDAQIRSERAKEEALIAEATSRTRIAGARNTTRGGPIPLYVEYIDRDGNIHYGPNPDLPDIEQFPAPGLIQVVVDPLVGDKTPAQTNVPVVGPGAPVVRYLMRDEDARSRIDRFNAQRRGTRQPRDDTWY